MWLYGPLTTSELAGPFSHRCRAVVRGSPGDPGCVAAHGHSLSPPLPPHLWRCCQAPWLQQGLQEGQQLVTQRHALGGVAHAHHVTQAVERPDRPCRCGEGGVQHVRPAARGPLAEEASGWSDRWFLLCAAFGRLLRPLTESGQGRLERDTWRGFPPASPRFGDRGGASSRKPVESTADHSPTNLASLYDIRPTTERRQRSACHRPWVLILPSITSLQDSRRAIDEHGRPSGTAVSTGTVPRCQVQGSGYSWCNTCGHAAPVRSPLPMMKTIRRSLGQTWHTSGELWANANEPPFGGCWAKRGTLHLSCDAHQNELITVS